MLQFSFQGGKQVTVQQVLDYFGGIAATSKALEISYQAVRQWEEKGSVPEGRQWQLQALTSGALSVDQKLSA
jgi:hypothetical protein